MGAFVVGGILSEPDWKAELRRDLVIHGFLAETDEERMAVVMPHIEAAYQRGLMAGRSQQSYASTRRKGKEKPKWYHLQQMETPSAPSASGTTPASAGDEP